MDPTPLCFSPSILQIYLVFNQSILNDNVKTHLFFEFRKTIRLSITGKSSATLILAGGHSQQYFESATRLRPSNMSLVTGCIYMYTLPHCGVQLQCQSWRGSSLKHSVKFFHYIHNKYFSLRWCNLNCNLCSSSLSSLIEVYCNGNWDTIYTSAETIKSATGIQGFKLADLFHAVGALLEGTQASLWLPLLIFVRYYFPLVGWIPVLRCG